MFPEVDVGVAALPKTRKELVYEKVERGKDVPCESVWRINEDDRTGKGHRRRVSGREDRDVHLLSYSEGYVRRDGFNRLEERRPFRECREIRDDAVNHVGRCGDGGGGVDDAVGGMGVVCHCDVGCWRTRCAFAQPLRCCVYMDEER